MNNLAQLKTVFNRFSICFFLAFQMVFAQGTEKFAVYVSGASDAGINKSLNNKLIATVSQSGKYAEIGDPEAFYEELAANNKVNISQITQTAKKHKADVVFTVSLTEALGAYSISARMLKTADAQIIKTASLDRSLKSLEDLTNVSNEITVQLLQLQPHETAFLPIVAAPLPASMVQAPQPVETTAPIAMAAAPKQCDKKYNINELTFKIKDGFPSQLSDCGTSLAKDIALSKVPFSKTAAPEPKSYMTKCTMDGIKASLPEDFPGVDKVLGDTQKFLQTVLNTALTGGVPNPASLLSAASDMSSLLDGINNLKTSNECIVDEPYTPPEPEPIAASNNNGNDTKDKPGETKVNVPGIIIASILAIVFTIVAITI